MLKIYLDFVEIRTKIATVIPFIVSYLVYLLIIDQNVNYEIMIVFFFALIFLDMSTTGLNNLVSLHVEKNKNNLDDKFLNYIDKKVIPKHFFTISLAITFFLGFFMSLYLVYLTNFYVLFLGLVAAFIAVTYSYGPLPIFKTPLGEIYSGFADGFLIPLIFFSTQMNNITIIDSDLVLTIHIINVIKFFLIFLPFFFMIANIMLANNLCDIENDILNNRHTLPIIIGKEKGLKLFKYNYILSFLAIIISCCLGYLPIIFLILVFIYIPISKNVKKFFETQKKPETFILSLKNMIVFSSAYIVISILAICLQKI